MKVLLSIKPQYADRIFNGEKKYEYRKSIFKRNDIDTVVVYSTKPVGKVIGEFEIDTIIKGTPTEVWEITKKYSGIYKKDYKQYFSGRNDCVAIAIKNARRYDEPIELNQYNPNIKVAPQSFIYLGDDKN